jgi:hypothetical protein
MSLPTVNRMKCPHCRSVQVERSRSGSARMGLLVRLFVVSIRCKICKRRFLRPRWARLGIGHSTRNWASRSEVQPAHRSNKDATSRLRVDEELHKFSENHIPELAQRIDSITREISQREANLSRLADLMNRLGMQPANDRDYQDQQRLVQSLRDELESLDKRRRNAYLEHAKSLYLPPFSRNR